MFCDIMNSINLDKPSDNILEKCKDCCNSCLVKVSIDENSFNYYFDFKYDSDVGLCVFQRRN